MPVANENLICVNAGCDRIVPESFDAELCLRHLRLNSEAQLQLLLASATEKRNLTLSRLTVDPDDLEYLATRGGDYFVLTLSNFDLRPSPERDVLQWPTGVANLNSIHLSDGRLKGLAVFQGDCLARSLTRFVDCHFLEHTRFTSTGTGGLELEKSTFKSLALEDTNSNTLLIRDCYIRSDLKLSGCHLHPYSRVSEVRCGAGSNDDNHHAGDLLIEACSIDNDADISLIEAHRTFVEKCILGDRSSLHLIEANELYFLSNTVGHDVALRQIEITSFLSVASLTSGDRALLELQSNTGEVSIDGATLGKMSTLRLNGPRVGVRRTDFPQGGSIEIAGEDIRLIQLRTAEALTIDHLRDEEGRPVRAKPKIQEIRTVDMSNIEMSNLDLSHAALRGVRNLGDLKIGTGLDFSTKRIEPLIARRMLADEVGWRLQRFSRPPSFSPLNRPVIDKDLLRDIEQSYRSLRKGLEDSGDQPGASDFYYGEMEMRRLRSRGWERLVLQAYWAISGYGLRAWRALLGLLVTLLLGTMAFWSVGFTTAQIGGFDVTSGPTGEIVRPRSFDSGMQPTLFDSAIFTVRTATSFARPGTPPPLTPAGNIIEVAVRILSPVLAALALLAIRARVKR